MSSLIDRIVGGIDDKRRWREFRARAEALPPEHRAAVDALQRYLTHRGTITRGDVLVAVHEELVTSFERAAADGTPVGDVVGGDPVRFADDLLARWAGGARVDGEQERLVGAIARAAAGSGSVRS